MQGTSRTRPTTTLRLRRLAPLVVALVLVAGACSSDDDESSTTTAPPSSTLPTVEIAGSRGVILDAVSETILGQPIEYPAGGAQVSSAVVTIEPGDETGWHHHDAPLYGYVLDGEVTVDYGEDGERTYAAGDAFMEAIGTSHNGRNDTDAPVTILTVNIGASGVENTVED